MSTTGLRKCETMWFKLGKIKGAQLKMNLASPIVYWMLIKNGKRTMMIRSILTELLECKVHEICLSFALFGTLGCNNSVRKHQITMVLCQFLIGIQYAIGLCKLIFNSSSSIFT